MNPLRHSALMGLGILTITVGALSVPQQRVTATLPAPLTQETSQPEDAQVEPIGLAAPVRTSDAATTPTRTVKPVRRTVATSPLLAIVQQPSINEEDQKIADETLRLILPERCHNVITKFFVTYDRDLKSRGYAGASTLIVQSLTNKDEERAIFLHEATHVLDLGCLTGTADSGESGFHDGRTVIYTNDPSVAFYSISWNTENIQSANAKKEDFVTGYAGSNAFEDVAESVTYYVLNQPAFRARAAKNAVMAKKLAWIETYVFPQGTDVATPKSKEVWLGRISWDATKTAYEWHSKQTVAYLGK